MKIIEYIKNNKGTVISCLFIVIAVILIVVQSVVIFSDKNLTQKGYEDLANKVEQNTNTDNTINKDEHYGYTADDKIEFGDTSDKNNGMNHMTYIILDEYKELFSINSDMRGWLTIDDTVIDYPVMQNVDENFYVDKDFYKNKSAAGALILDNDSEAGIGTKEFGYDIAPTTNLIIHGHTMKNGTMFGRLKDYKDKEYFDKHRIIKFSSLYEHREYEVISAFYSQVYLKSDTESFKFYKFFKAKTQEELNYWIDNISKLNLHNVDIKAELGDEFLTLTCCAYHVENGRFVVVAKRIK